MEKILIKDLIAKASEKLKKAEVTDYVIDSRLLAEYVFHIDYYKLLVHPDMETDVKNAQIYNQLIEKRAGICSQPQFSALLSFIIFPPYAQSAD